MVYGLALRTEGSLSYNYGVPATGCTSPLWAIVAALAHLGAHGPSMGAVLAVKGIGIALHGLGVWLAVDLVGREAPPRTRMIGSIATGVALGLAPIGAFAAVSGMEVTLTTALLLGTFHSMRQHSRLAASLLGLAMVARPECLVVVPIVAVASLALVRRPMRMMPFVLVPPLCVIARTWLVSGRPLPATFYQKARTPHFDRLDVHVRFVLDDLLGQLEPYGRPAFGALLLLAMFLASIALFPRRRARRVRSGPVLAGAMAASCIGWVSALILSTGLPVATMFYWQRYYAPILPVGLAGAILATACLAARIPARPAFRVAVLVVPTLMLVLPEGLALAGERARYASDVDAIDSVQVALGRRIAEAPADEVVWSQDAGAPRYFGRHQVVDLCRLNTPELLTSPDVPVVLAPTLIVIPPALWHVDGRTVVVAEAQPDPYVDRTSRQVILRCPTGGHVSLSFNGVRVATAACAR